MRKFSINIYLLFSLKDRREFCRCIKSTGRNVLLCISSLVVFSKHITVVVIHYQDIGFVKIIDSFLYEILLLQRRTIPYSNSWLWWMFDKLSFWHILDHIYRWINKDIKFSNKKYWIEHTSTIKIYRWFISWLTWNSRIQYSDMTGIFLNFYMKEMNTTRIKNT